MTFACSFCSLDRNQFVGQYGFSILKYVLTSLLTCHLSLKISYERKASIMEHSHYPFATQDWSLIRHRTLTLQANQVRAVEAVKGELWITIDGNCNDFFVRAGESVAIPCRKGNVVVESTSATSIVRIALTAQSPLVERVGPSFAQAFSVTVTRPIAAILCSIGTGLRKLAVQLDPKLARA
jgi:hypothetical protein